MHKEGRTSCRAMVPLVVFAITVLGSGCSSLRSPAWDQPYWAVSSEDESTPQMQAFEDILYWTVYGFGSVLAH
jgi:hypothetical protein